MHTIQINSLVFGLILNLAIVTFVGFGFPTSRFNETQLYYFKPINVNVMSPKSNDDVTDTVNKNANNRYYIRFDKKQNIIWIHDKVQAKDNVLCASNNSITRTIDKPYSLSNHVLSKKRNARQKIEQGKMCIFDTFCDSDDPYFPLINLKPKIKDITFKKDGSQHKVVKFGSTMNFYLDFDLLAFEQSNSNNDDIQKLKQSNVKNVGIRLCRSDESHHQLFQRVSIPSFVTNKQEL